MPLAHEGHGLALSSSLRPSRAEFRRAKVRGVRDFYTSARASRRLLCTEFGSPTPPAGERADVTEAKQALECPSLAYLLYEGFKGFMPHVMTQSEADPANKEDWYGISAKTCSPSRARRTWHRRTNDRR